jgi:ankyrin repeat protein
MQHGGNPNSICRRGLAQFSPLMTVMAGFYPDKNESIQLLIDAGADLDYGTDTGNTALLTSLSGGYFSITLQLLEAGASFNLCKDNGGTFVHSFLREAPEITSKTATIPPTPEQIKHYAEVLAWLEANGADLEGARKDNKTWAQGGKLSPARIAELKKRYEDELAAKRKDAP